ncbi:MAG: XrtA/PEP-CTERM system histidine kinase PrsK, partial [Deltaproteobacteria bacterium]
VYAAFAIWVAIGSRASARARLLLLALVGTALWAACSIAVVATPSPWTRLGLALADAIRYGTWFVFLWHVLAPSPETRKGVRWPAFASVTAVLLASVLLDTGLQIEADGLLAGNRPAYLLHLGLAVLGLSQIEQVVRRVHPETRWGIKPLAIALAGVFGIDLFVYADALLFGVVDADAWIARAVANAIVVPLIAVATARSTGWTVDLHVSRRVVFQSTALLVSGVFLLAVAVAGYVVRYVGGDWARALQIELLFAAAIIVALVTSSGRFRARLKVFVSKHFFSYSYDYREEWLRFTRTLSTESGSQTLPARTIVALADLVESPAGLLLLHEESRGYIVSARWNMQPTEAAEPDDGALPAFLRRTGWIVGVAECRAQPSRYDGLVLPDWVASLASPWLIVPLILGTELLGFLVLATPRTKIEVDWEVRDLLKTASRQAASYLGQVRAAEALLEARKFDAFNRMSAFVVHDLKNLVSQLSLMHRNAERHRDNPAFQSDMLVTVAHVVERMNALMLQLRTGTRPIESARNVDLEAVLRRVCSGKAGCPVPVDLRASGSVTVVGHEDRLEHVIGHLVQNAIDATPPGQRVDLSVAVDGQFVVVSVVDRGSGMTPEFVRERLFKPFQTTKPMGMGIGVYESQQYVTSVGGDIRIDSKPGMGTRVEVRLRLVEPPQASQAQRTEERIA